MPSETTRLAPVIVGSGEGKTVSVVVDTYCILISGKETGIHVQTGWLV